MGGKIERVGGRKERERDEGEGCVTIGVSNSISEVAFCNWQTLVSVRRSFRFPYKCFITTITVAKQI